MTEFATENCAWAKDAEGVATKFSLREPLESTLKKKGVVVQKVVSAQDAVADRPPRLWARRFFTSKKRVVELDAIGWSENHLPVTAVAHFFESVQIRDDR